MNNWEEYKINELCVITRGGSPRPIQKFLSLHGTPWVKIADATKSNSRFIEKTKEYIIKEGESKSRIVYPGDLILSNSATPGLPKFMKIKACIHDGWLLLRDFKGVDKCFLYYLLINDRKILINKGNGSVFTNLKTEILKEHEVNLPPLSTQCRIADILSALDNKIENNRKTSEKLEQIAQAVFKQWFVDFEFDDAQGQPYKSSGGRLVESELGMIPEGWSVNRIIDLDIIISDYVANGSFKSLKDNVRLYEKDNHAIFIRNTDLKCDFANGMKYVDEHSYDFLRKTKLHGGEIIISNVADVGSVYLCPYFNKPMTLGNNVIMLKTPNDTNWNLYIYRLFRSYVGQGMLEAITGGSAQLKFNKTDFRNLKILIPKGNIFNKYLSLEDSLENLINSYKKEINLLQQTRDTLLPKLMSGEVEV